MRLSWRQPRSATHRVDDISDRLDDCRRREQMDLVAGTHNQPWVHYAACVWALCFAARTADPIWWPTFLAGGLLFGSVAWLSRTRTLAAIALDVWTKRWQTLILA